MPINAMIAQGFQPIGRDLPEVANMLYQRKRQEQQDTRRNELVAIEQAQEQRRNAMLDEKMGWERQDRAQASTKEQELADLRRVYPALKAGDPRAFEYVLEQLGPEASQFYRDKPEQLMEWARREVGDPGEIGSQQIPGYGTVVTQGGKITQGRPTPSFAPDRPTPESYDTVQTAEGVYRVSNRDPSKKERIGGVVPRASATDGWGDPTAAALPAGIPQGSVQIGTSGGKPVYEDPSGKRWVVE